jgi:hypothetical protein
MDDIRIVLGSLRYKTATNTDLSIPTPLVQNSKNLQEFDRSVDVNLAQVFDDERQKSTTFRPVCKFQILFNNSYTGSTNYPPLENNLYYINETALTIKQCTLNPTSVYWEGFPQYDEFDFIRSDYNVSGYTVPIPSTIPGGIPSVHIDFVAKSASTYNWNHFVSYPYKNVNKVMTFYDVVGTNTPSLVWNAVDGIPFFVKIDDSTVASIANGVAPNPLLEGGNRIIQFKCPVKHGLSESEFVKITLTNGYTNTFQVFSFGNDLPGTEEYIFNLFDIGYGSIFNDGDKGTFKRVINYENPNDTTSKYYVIQHKIITDVNDAVLVNAGFEKNIFGTNKKFESPAYTPNNVKRVSIKENSQSYTLSFNKDIDINELRDNQKRPISELYITTVWKGFFGLTFGGVDDNLNATGLQEGFDFNIPIDTINNEPQGWWNINNTNSNFVDSNNNPYPITTYNTPEGTIQIPNGGTTTTIQFTYLNSLKNGDTINGNYCEWNDYEQKERVISEMYHKFIFNSDVFDIRSVNDNKPFGYYYQPNRVIKIRGFSDYIETGSINNMADVPDYSYFSTTYNSFIWRDLYTYGFKDGSGNGVDYPFLNGKHYPYENFIFRIIPEGTNYIESALHNYATLYGAAQPIKDNCE